MVYLTRIERFNAAHKLWVNDWSEEKNIEVFGKCCNKNWHDHNYTLFVTVKGKPNPITGFIIDAKKLSLIIREYATDKLDHTNLNLDVDFIPQNLQPTTENLIMLIWQQLEQPIKKEGGQLHYIKLEETPTIYAEYYGE
jgi:6-pyruvoyltetrahydropterin/6-carboxytetrahydropterin synthase